MGFSGVLFAYVGALFVWVFTGFRRKFSDVFYDKNIPENLRTWHFGYRIELSWLGILIGVVLAYVLSKV